MLQPLRDTQALKQAARIREMLYRICETRSRNQSHGLTCKVRPNHVNFIWWSKDQPINVSRQRVTNYQDWMQKPFARDVLIFSGNFLEAFGGFCLYLVVINNSRKNKGSRGFVPVRGPPSCFWFRSSCWTELELMRHSAASVHDQLYRVYNWRTHLDCFNLIRKLFHCRGPY